MPPTDGELVEKLAREAERLNVAKEMEELQNTIKDLRQRIAELEELLKNR